jgi:hypothetical protein
MFHLLTSLRVLQCTTHQLYALFFGIFFGLLLFLRIHFIILLLLFFQPITFSLAPPSWSLATLIIHSSSLLFQHASLLLHFACYVDYKPLGAFISNLGLKYLSNLIPHSFVCCVLVFLTCLHLYFPLTLLCANLQVRSFQFPTFKLQHRNKLSKGKA